MTSFTVFQSSKIFLKFSKSKGNLVRVGPEKDGTTYWKIIPSLGVRIDEYRVYEIGVSRNQERGLYFSKVVEEGYLDFLNFIKYEAKVYLSLALLKM